MPRLSQNHLQMVAQTLCKVFKKSCWLIVKGLSLFNCIIMVISVCIWGKK